MEQTSLIKIDATEYGLQESKAREIEAVFLPMIEKMKELESEYEALIKQDLTEDICKKAKELRMKYVKVRTGTASIHKEVKAFYLAGCKFVDGWKNAQLYASQGKEDKLQEIETYYENLEKEKRKKLHEDRVAEYAKYSPNVTSLNFADMTEEIWDTFISGAKANYEAKILAEKKAEEERIERERIEQERLKEIEEQKKKELQKKKEEEKKRELERQAELKLAREQQAKLQAEKEQAEKEHQAKLEAQRKEQQEKIDAERKERERIEKEHQAKLQQEKIERAKIEEELRLKNEAEEQKKELERQALIKKQEEEKRLKLAPDKEKIILYASKLREFIVANSPQTTSYETGLIVHTAFGMMEDVINYIDAKAKEL